MATVSFDKETSLFGWAAPFDLYDPELPCTVVIPPTTDGRTGMTIAAGCKLQTLLHALQSRGMEKPGD